MKSYEQEVKKVLKAFDESGALPYVVISGSWAMYFYKTFFENFMPRVETTDLDLFLPNPKKANSDGLVDRLRKLSYIRNDDYLTGKTVFLSEQGFSIEFLTIPNRSMSNTIKVPGFLVTAEALPKMAPAGWNYIQVEFNSLTVNVVSPVSFVLQKLLINSERNETKRDKDIDAIKYVLPYVKASKKYYAELQESLNKYPKKWVKIILENARKSNIEL